VVLRHRDFALHWSGQMVSQLGSQLNYVALAWIVLRATGSATAMAGVYLAQILPPALFGWIGGVMVDRSDRRRLMIVCDLVRCALVAVLPLVGPKLWAVYAVTFAVSALTLLFYAAEKSVIPHLVPEDEWTEGNAFAEITSQAAGLAGPVVAGLLLVWLPSPADVLYVDAATFAVSAVCIAAMRWRDRSHAGEGEVVGAALEGLRFLVRDRFLLVVLVTAAVGNFLAMPFAVVFPVLSERVLGSGAPGFGGLMGGFGGGMLVGSLAAAALARRLSPGAVVYGGMALLGVSFAAMSAVGGLWIDVALAALAGFGVAPGNAVVLTLVQQRTPSDMQGRVFASLFTLVGIAAPLGVALAGPCLDAFGPLLLLLGIGALTVACAVAGWTVLTRLALPSHAP